MLDELKESVAVWYILFKTFLPHSSDTRFDLKRYLTGVAQSASFADFTVTT